MPTTNASDHGSSQQRSTAVGVWLCAIAILAAIRYRGEIGPYKSLHIWMNDAGLPSWVRNSDTELLLLLFGSGLYALLRRVGRHESRGFLSDIGLRTGVLKGVAAGVVICLPIVLYGLVRGLMQEGTVFLSPKMVRIGLTGPIVEEWFFRGILVLAMVRLARTRFWLAAIVGALLFGAVHVQWTAEGLARGWPAFLATGAGGVWFAWLARQWSWNLLVPITAHMLMNTAATWYGGTDHTMGNIHFEIGRAATITLGTVMAIHPGLFKMGWTTEPGAGSR
jgi:membrane protease YdiL (CAAX protease family)